MGAVNFTSAGLLELDARHWPKRDFFPALAFKTAEVEPHAVPLAAQLAVHTILPVRPRGVNRARLVERAHLSAQVALVIDRPSRAGEVDVEGARIAAALAAGSTHMERLRRPESVAVPVGVSLAGAGHPLGRKLEGQGRDPCPGDDGITPPLGGVHRCPGAQVGTAAPAGEHVVGAAPVVAAALGVHERALGGAPCRPGLAAHAVVRRRHLGSWRSRNRAPRVGASSIPGTHLWVGDA